MMQCTPAELRQLVTGLWRAEGRWQQRKQRMQRICTSSAAFRDQLIQLLLHCGFSAHHRLFYPRGALRGYTSSTDQRVYSAECVQSLERDERWTADMLAVFSPITAPVDAWAVEWSAPTTASGKAACFPRMRRQQSIRRVPYSRQRDGRIWCVHVDHADHLILRSAGRATRGRRHQAVQALGRHQLRQHVL